MKIAMGQWWRYQQEDANVSQTTGCHPIYTHLLFDVIDVVTLADNAMAIDQRTAVDAVDAVGNAGRQRPMVRYQRATVDAVDAITLADNAQWL